MGSFEELKEIVGDYSTNQDGLLKPMLAKSETQITNRKIFEKEWYASRKINGVRTLVYYKNGALHTASRGGATNYDFVLDHILSHPALVQYFKDHPDLILDSEAYKFGWTLNKISGICRTQKTAYDGEPLELYVYDIVDVNKTFEERLNLLDEFSQALDLSFDPERNWNEGELKIQIVPHELISGWEYIKKLHDEWVSEGWEGLVLRDPEAKYKPGGRTQIMVKVKEYKDAEYEIVGLSEGNLNEVWSVYPLPPLMRGEEPPPDTFTFIPPKVLSAILFRYSIMSFASDLILRYFIILSIEVESAPFGVLIWLSNTNWL